ncbi:MAG TPA: SprT family zinc-dependent metalloprotease [Candidatus Saccharimonadales bacterium]|nr:SprT family zinc-dependent metalloprotease [Candidatus Saccharimonadales bacterium]
MTEIPYSSSLPSPLNTKHQMIYNNKIMEFQIIRSQRRRKTSEISVVNGVIYLKTPLSTTIHDIESLVRRKANWIIQRLDEQNNPAISIRIPTYTNNSTLPYLGKNYPLKIVSCNYDSLEFSDAQFTIYTMKKNVKHIYERWLFNSALSVFVPIITKYSQILYVTPKKIFVKQLKSRWGSATYHNTINLNVHLMKAPLSVIEYVILHELCHLIERNHSGRFWKLVSDNMTDYKTQTKWLQINGSYLL